MRSEREIRADVEAILARDAERDDLAATIRRALERLEAALAEPENLSLWDSARLVAGIEDANIALSALLSERDRYRDGLRELAGNWCEWGCDEDARRYLSDDDA